MSAVSSIEWTDRTWNPVRGCSRVSPGCDRCYAMHFAHRFSGEGGVYEGLTVLRPTTASRPGVDWSGSARFVPEMLGEPLKWRKPQRVFVNSMSDLFHESLTNEEIAAVFGVMAACPQHTFQVLTKRPKRAAEWFAWAAGKHGHNEAGALHVALCDAMQGAGDWDPDDRHCEELLSNANEWPLHNVWLGVSTEDQKTADERIPLLLELPAAVRFVSAEPLLGPLDLSRYMWPVHWSWDARFKTPEEAIAAGAHAVQRRQGLVSAHAVFIDWVIVGGESGNGARPFHVDWARALVQQCATAGVACFVKQLGAAFEDPANGVAGVSAKVSTDLGITVRRLSDRKGGDMAEWPEALRVRQFPAVRA